MERCDVYGVIDFCYKSKKEEVYKKSMVFEEKCIMINKKELDVKAFVVDMVNGKVKKWKSENINYYDDLIDFVFGNI